MKNIHVTPTDKPSRLYKNDNQVLTLNTHPVLKGIFTNGIGSNQHIYITNSEKIKEGDWLFSSKTNNIFKADSIEYLESHNMIEDFDKSFYINSKYSKKIILTTDKDLIADGVQAIDDDFLEWFVKNPSCEFVEVREEEVFVGFIDGNGKKPIYDDEYNIIIPKEELKQETLEKAADTSSSPVLTTKK